MESAGLIATLFQAVNDTGVDIGIIKLRCSKCTYCLHAGIGAHLRLTHGQLCNLCSV